jgi:flavocytochrome c
MTTLPFLVAMVMTMMTTRTTTTTTTTSNSYWCSMAQPPPEHHQSSPHADDTEVHSLSLSTSSSSAGEDLLSSSTSTRIAPFPLPTIITGGGEDEIIADTECTMNDLERANNMQLHVIFDELTSTNFFQHFVVDLEHTCPLSSWRNKKNMKKEGEQETTKASTTTATTTTTTSISSTTDQEEQLHVLPNDDEFHCDGGADELDDDAEPLCGVDAGTFGNDMMFLGSYNDNNINNKNDNNGGGDQMSSIVLQSLSQTGFSSQHERDTFAWNQQTDMVVQETETPCDTAATITTTTTNSQQQHQRPDQPGALTVPDSFWMDMCSNIHKGSGTKLVNLALNPERNTYYNGTHIWKAIYEENCITTDQSCLEERVLYKLLSGMHTSTTLSIAQNYYPPSKRHNRTRYQPNPQYFMQKFQYHPDHIRNLHFAYVVMLRAINKARTYLYHYDIVSGNVMEDEASSILLKRLLDTTIMRSCSNVFSAFDESVMFQEDDQQSNLVLQHSFKGVFHNISSILDCVQCQQCKLHGKLTMLGYGTALKILFVQSMDNLVLEPNEVVALINTAARLSESLIQVRDLTMLYWQQQEQEYTTTNNNKNNINNKIVDWEVTTQIRNNEVLDTTTTTTLMKHSWDSLESLDVTIGLIATLAKENYISRPREKELIDMALSRNPELLILGKHYNQDLLRFAELSKNLSWSGTITTTKEEDDNDDALLLQLPVVMPPDAIVIGSGLAGLAASLNILDRGGTVVIVEKEHLLGGNSNKASSGINGCCPHQNDTYYDNDDSLESFRNDTIRSAGAVADLDLIDVLVNKSEQAVLWLQDRAKVDLSLLAQLGGHSHQRTHRPSNGMAGAEIIYHLQKAVRAFEETGRVKIMVDTRVTELLTNESGDRVVGVVGENTKDGTSQEIRSDHVILATGGFASDRSSGSYLDRHRPELMSFPATAGAFSTGDGITLATTLGAATRDMDKVQIHPTGWVDPSDPENPTKILAAELMRGVGGILINNLGQRFCNELGTRAYVTDQMLKHDKNFAETGRWNRTSKVPTFHLVLSSSASTAAKKHVDLYSHKGLLTRLVGVDALAKFMNVDRHTVTATLRDYQVAATAGVDSFGKTSFSGVPSQDLENEVFYVGTVTPVLHYCMGGIKIDTEGNVIREDGTPIEGLHAAGEVTGGVHGNNRLGGNSLLECTVFGTIVGQKVPIKEKGTSRIAIGNEMLKPSGATSNSASKELPTITMTELSKHNKEDDLWVAIHGTVYDLTEFAHEHPAGFDSIFDLAGTDGTEAFDAVHNLGMLEDFEQDKRGVLLT